jgi:metal-dependent hydrolase (beta-lactamase superfamily II)
MSDNIEDFENKLILILRKAQEGKTFICISSICKDLTTDIHIVLTMNTLSSGMQFFGRMETSIGSKNIIVFNSNKTTVGEGCHHAKTPSEVFMLLKQNSSVKVIVCCAHTTRIKKSLPELFELIDGNIYLKERRFKIHIDEAHKYICENRPAIKKLNNLNCVRKIYGYTATPGPIISNVKDDVKYFSNIYICDVEKEYGITRSDEYFGVKDCQPNIINYNNMDQNDEYSTKNIPANITNLCLNKKRQPKHFYDNKFMFSLGDEIALFRFYEYILPTLSINQQGFSYHFSPAYARIVCQLQLSSIILKHFPESNIIIINGDGIQLFRGMHNSGKVELTRIKTSHQITGKDDLHSKQLLEPSYMIQSLIEDYRDFPTFVTGLACVSMSVTLVNQQLGNFDTVIMSHSHYDKEDLYQLCRFLFNYSSWETKNKILKKNTVFVSATQEVFNTCLQYEKYIEDLSGNSAGKYMTNSEVRVLTKREQRRNDLDSISKNIEWGWKRFVVDSDCESDTDELGNFSLERAENFYKLITEITCPSRSKPKRYVENSKFWACATTASSDIHEIAEMEKKTKGDNWDTYFQLVHNKTKYASRMFVGYEKKDDYKNYTIYIKWAKLEPSALDTVNKWCKKRDATIPNNENDDDSILPGSEEYEDIL